MGHKANNCRYKAGENNNHDLIDTDSNMNINFISVYFKLYLTCQINYDVFWLCRITI